MMQPVLSGDRIADGLCPVRVGRAIRTLGDTTSTNDVVLAAAAADEPCDGLAVFAEHQTAGRGRQGRPWLSPRGAAVLCSVLLIEPDDVARVGSLTLAAGVAVCDAVHETTMIAPLLRWPNDVIASGRKLAGILAESRPLGGGRRAWAVGVGINVYQQRGHFPPDLRDVATSLELLTHEPVDRTRVARELLRQLDMWLLAACAGRADEVRAAWLERAEPFGQRVRVVSDGTTFEGRTIDVDPEAGLLLQLESGGRRWFNATYAHLL